MIKNTLPPLSLYIHMPWCIKKCPYCDFNSHTLKNEMPEMEYIEALLKDLQYSLPQVDHRPLHSIFFGGGTPSLFSATSLNILLEKINTYIPFTPDMEITLETNPGTVEHKNFNDYKSAGITRISLGAQSFQDEKLKALGRIHNAAEIKKAIQKIQAANFASFNIDVMYGLPHQSVSDALYDINTALAFSPPHISWYNLTIEPNTLFFHQTPPLPLEDSVMEIFEVGMKTLQEAYQHYEVSAFAKPLHQCAHNVNYWQFGDYIGIGAGAHGKITHKDFKTITRTQKIRHPKNYLQAATHDITTTTAITEKDIAFEFMLNALRLIEGFPLSLFEQRTNLSLQSIATPLSLAQEKGFITLNNEFLQLTKQGKYFLNDVMQLFLP